MGDLAAALLFARKTIDIFGNLLVDEGVRLYWVKEDIMWIHREMRRMQSFLIDLDAQKNSSCRVGNLVRDVRDLAYAAEDITDTYIPKLSSQNNHFYDWITRRLDCFPCGSRHKFLMEVVAIKRRVEDINRARLTYGIDENIGLEEWNPRPCLHDEAVVIGFEINIKALEAGILNEDTNFCAISISGMAGVGKTTLAKKIYNSVKNKFSCSAWIYVSKKPKLGDLVKDIAKQVELDAVLQEENLEANLFEFLKNNRFLIVIDDIWDVKAWDALKTSIPGTSDNQSRLLLTSRNTNLGLYVADNCYLHKLEPLNQEMSWELFSVKIHIDNTDHMLMDIGKKIVKRCKGLPLSIVTTSGLLSTKGKTEHEWQGVLNRMGHEKNGICALSYSDLPIALKPCFLYFGLFPEDHIVPVRDLINLWVAEGFIQSQGMETLEEAGLNYLDELVTRNLIQVEHKRYDGRIKYCRIHDVLHDLSISIAQEEDFLVTQRENASVTALETRRVAFNQQSIYNETSAKHQFPKLRALLYFDTVNEIPSGALLNDISKGGLRLLRVLRVEGLKYGEMLPKDIGNLVHLRYLRLRGIGLILPSTIGNLKKLQVLDYEQYEGLILPTFIWKMDKLRHIYITNTAMYNERQPEVCNKKRRIKVVEQISLPNLQTLYSIDTSFLNPDCLLRLASLKKLGIFGSRKHLAGILTKTTPISKKLEMLQLVLDSPYIRKDSVSLQHPDYDLPTLDFSGYLNIRTLYLDGLLRRLPIFPTSLAKLILVKTQLEKDPMEELGKLPSLRVLQLRRNTYIGHVMVISGPDSFPCLEILKIERMQNIQILKVEDGDKVMPKLHNVRINFTVQLDIQSERLKSIFLELSQHLLYTNILEFSTELMWLEDDINDSVVEENEFIERETEVAAMKGKEVISANGTDGEITKLPKGFSVIELGECSSPKSPKIYKSDTTIIAGLH